MKAWVNGLECSIEPDDILKLQDVISLQLLGYNDKPVSFDVAKPNTLRGLYDAKASCKTCCVCSKEFAAKRKRVKCCSVFCSMQDTKKRVKANVKCQQSVMRVNQVRLTVLANQRADRLKNSYIRLLSDYPALADTIQQQLWEVLQAVNATKVANIVTE